MLPAAYNWIEVSDGLRLRFNYLGVAHVRRNGQCRIRWQGEDFALEATNLVQGVDAVERWIVQQGGLPGIGRR